MLKNRQNTAKIVKKSSKMLKNRIKTTKYVEKPLTNRQKRAKTVKKRKTIEKLSKISKNR